jgi:hypothetical protein
LDCEQGLNFVILHNIARLSPKLMDIPFQTIHSYWTSNSICPETYHNISCSTLKSNETQ